MNKIKDKIKKWKNFNKLNKIYDNTIFIIEILLSIIMGYYILKLLCNYQETLQFSKIMITVSIIIVIPIILIILINLYKYRKCVQKLFLTVIIPIGILYAFMMLPDGGPDEKAHYYRA